MTAADFRRLALELPEAVEGSHVDHADFRAGGKIFASLAPDESWGMVKLTPAQQSVVVAVEPKAYQPFNGAWGKRGCTKVLLKSAKKTSVRIALGMAWRNTAPKKLLLQHDELS